MWDHRRITDIQLSSCIPLQHLLQQKESSLAPQAETWDKLMAHIYWNVQRMVRMELSAADGWLPVVLSKTVHWGQSCSRSLFMTWHEDQMDALSVCRWHQAGWHVALLKGRKALQRNLGWQDWWIEVSCMRFSKAKCVLHLDHSNHMQYCKLGDEQLEICLQ